MGRIQCRGQLVDHPYYALACVLHQCLTAQTPYPGDSLEQQITGHLTLEPPEPSAIDPAIPAAFNEVIARGMAKDPELRYQTAGELATAARQALTDPPAVTPAQAQPTVIEEPLPAPATPTTSEDTPEDHDASPGADAASASRWAGVAAAARRRWVPIGAVAAVLATAAVGVGIWALSSRRSVPFTPGDLDVLNTLNATEYGGANCRHLDPPSPAKALLGCVPNLPAGSSARDVHRLQRPGRRAGVVLRHDQITWAAPVRGIARRPR